LPYFFERGISAFIGRISQKDEAAPNLARFQGSAQGGVNKPR
jgi:hypothetical protein